MKNALAWMFFMIAAGYGMMYLGYLIGKQNAVDQCIDVCEIKLNEHCATRVQKTRTNATKFCADLILESCGCECLMKAEKHLMGNVVIGAAGNGIEL